MRKRYISKRYEEAPIIECACGCGAKFKAVDKEGRQRRFISGHNGKKYDDPTQYKREWNHRNREKRYEYKKAYGQKRKGKLLALLGGQCVKCGLRYDGENAPIFDFHHLRDKEFSLGVGGMVDRSWEKILQEAEKCEVVCANCHRMIDKEKY